MILEFLYFRLFAVLFVIKPQDSASLAPPQGLKKKEELVFLDFYYEVKY